MLSHVCHFSYAYIIALCTTSLLLYYYYIISPTYNFPMVRHSETYVVAHGAGNRPYKQHIMEGCIRGIHVTNAFQPTSHQVNYNIMVTGHVLLTTSRDYCCNFIHCREIITTSICGLTHVQPY